MGPVMAAPVLFGHAGAERRPGAVADDLDLDVARTPNQLFQIDRVIAEAELGLAPP